MIRIPPIGSAFTLLAVVPAEAGTHIPEWRLWVPAFAGTTV